MRMTFGCQKTSVQIPAPPHPGCAILGEKAIIKLWYHQLYNRITFVVLKGDLENLRNQVRAHGQCLTHDNQWCCQICVLGRFSESCAGDRSWVGRGMAGGKRHPRGGCGLSPGGRC